MIFSKEPNIWAALKIAQSGHTVCMLSGSVTISMNLTKLVTIFAVSSRYVRTYMDIPWFLCPNSEIPVKVVSIVLVLVLTTE